MIQYDKLDLNLLRVFNAVMQEQSVVKAAQRLYLSQSAVSHALSRLKENLGEELFVRTSKGMSPTTFALEISRPVREALDSIGSALATATSTFDPLTVDRTFTIAANDYTSAVILPGLFDFLMINAPKANLVIRPSTRIDLAEQIDLGRIDIAIGTFKNVPSRFKSITLMEQDEVLICRRGHPLSKRPVHVEDLANFPIAVVSLGGHEGGEVSGFISERGLARRSEMYDRPALEKALADLGRRPDVKVTIAHFLVIPMLLKSNDLVAIVPRALARALTASYKILTLELPYTHAPQKIEAIWHHHNDTDPAHSWLRNHLSQCLLSIEKSLDMT